MTGNNNIKRGRRFARPPGNQTTRTEAHRAPSPGAERGAEAGVAKAPPVPARSPRAQSKIALITELLGRADGASLAELVAATGWQTHTTRAALTGLRKKGHSITKASADGVTRYAISPRAREREPDVSCNRKVTS